MKNAKYRAREEHVACRGAGSENGRTAISQQPMLLTDEMLALVKIKQNSAGHVVELRQEGANIMKLACSVLLRQPALATSSKTAQVVIRQF